MLLVLGYGNTLRGDDGFGPAVASYLQDQVCDQQSLEILSEQQLLPEHAERVAGSKLVIFVDASQTTEAGQIVCINLAQDRDCTHQTTSSVLAHSLSPAAILELAASLYGRTPEAYLFTVGTASIELGESLSPLVEKAVPVVAELILSRLAHG